jgi:two-component system chemotaxis sensor kinase CheA
VAAELGEAVELIDITYFLRTAYPDLDEQMNTGGKKVLVVDDDLFFRDMLSPVLTSADYRVDTAASAREALEKIEQGSQFDAVVIDSELLDQAGQNFAKALREMLARANFRSSG